MSWLRPASYARAVANERAAFDRYDMALSTLRERVEMYLRSALPDLILIVEDNLSNAALIRAALKHHRTTYRTKHVTTMRSAISAIRDSDDPVSLAIVDMHLPDGNGWDLVTSIPYSVSVVITSAEVNPDDMSKVKRRTGAQAIVSLGDMNGLLRTIDDLMRR